MWNYIYISGVGFLLGIWLAGSMAFPLSVLYGMAFIFLILSVYSIFRKLRRVGIFIAALFLVVGMIRFMQADMIPMTDISRYEGQNVTICGRIDEIPYILDTEKQVRKIKYIINVTVAGLKEQDSFVSSGRVVIYVQQAEDAQLASYGDAIEAEGKVVLPHAYNNPGMINSIAMLKRQGITARVYAKQVKIVDKEDKTSWLEILAQWRANRKNEMLAVMPEGDAAILTGMLFGGYDGIKRDVVRDFSTTGIVHILSVSGTHIALVAGLILWLGTRFKIRYGLIVLLAAGGISVYAVLSGLTPPVVRSALMGLVLLAAVGLKREKDTGNALVLTAVCMLAYQPHLLYDVSFQLSFVSTAGLVFLYPRLSKMLADFLPGWLSGAVAVTVSAQLAVLPFIAWYFNSFSLSAFIANVIVVPIIESLVVIGLLGCLCMPFIATAGYLVFVLCSVLIGTVVELTALLAALPGSSVYMPAFNLPAALLYYVFLGWIFNYLPVSYTIVDILKKWPYKSVCAGAAFLAFLLVYTAYPRPVAVHFIDVGQGDATLVTTPHGRAVLIDTGGTVNLDTSFDIGEKVTVPYMKHYGVTELDYLLLTHGHNDHAGGAAFIAANLPVRNVMLPQEDYQPAVKALVRATKYQKIIPQYKGQNILLDGVEISMVYVPLYDNVHKSNENCSVIKISYGQHSFLITGDLEAKGEAAAIAKGLGKATVLKVGHHGSKTSTTSQFLGVVSPQYAVISVGYDNRFGHPHEEVLRRLAAGNIKIFRTDRQGAITFRTDGNTLAVETVIKDE